MFFKKMTKNDFWWQVFSENGFGSAKRIVGTFIIICCMFCMIWLCISEGGTTIVEGLIQTGIIVACALLGLSSVTSIWKGGKATAINNAIQNEKPDSLEEDKEKEEKNENE